MTSWELQDMAVQIVRDYLEKQGYHLMSWQSNPDVDPAIWFLGDDQTPEWVVVRGIRYPANKALKPENWQAITDQCAHMSRTGHFASVALVSTVQRFESENQPVIPLWRGYPIHIHFNGLK